MLTLRMVQDALGSLPDHAEPVPMILPTWFPDEHLGLAERWARDHGWEGVQRVPERGRTQAQST